MKRLVLFGCFLVVLGSVTAAQDCDGGNCYVPRVKVEGMSVSDHLERDHGVKRVPVMLSAQNRLHDLLHGVDIPTVGTRTRVLSSGRIADYRAKRRFGRK